jgi:hypothetical protein
LAAPPIVHTNHAIMLARLGRHHEAIAKAQRALSPQAKRGWQEGFMSLSDGGAALALAAAGARDAAEQVVARILAGVPERRFSAGYASVVLGRIEEGIALLRDVPQFTVFFVLTLADAVPGLADDPRWQALVRELHADDADVARRRVMAGDVVAAAISPDGAR